MVLFSLIALLHLTLKWLENAVYSRSRPAVSKIEEDSSEISNGDKDSSMFDVPTIDSDAVYQGEDIVFRPQVYTQRYYMIGEIIRKKSLNVGVKKIVDLGCAELALFSWLKNNLIAEEYVAVDIDEELLSRSSCRVQPSTSDHVFKRCRPLNVKVLCGSADVPDLSLKGADCIVAVELIEHLYPTTLEALPYCIFGVIQPEIAVFTTPNSDFNVLFRNFTGFRHDDHKFEWTREQFECWADNLTTRYPNYEVKFGGVGPGPPGTEHLGYCSQIALFFRKGPPADVSDEYVEDSYKVIRNVDFPFQSLEDKKKDVLLYDTGFYLDRLTKNDTYRIKGRIVVPMKVLVDILNSKCECSEDEIRGHIPPCWSIEETSSEINLVLDESFVDELFSDFDSDPPYDCEDNFSEHECGEKPASDSECWDTDPKNEQAGCSETHKTNGEFGFDASAVNGSKNTSLNTFPQNTKAKETLSNINSDFSAEMNVISLPKCLSLEQLNPNRVRNKSFRFSLNMDKSDHSCDIDCANNDGREQLASSSASVLDSVGLRLEDSCSQSKAADSGYPNSSCFDMDTDFTPEQVDEIITESESSFDGEDGSLSGDEPQVEENVGGIADVVVFHENVENGDVANNNRDGEGNNMEENRPVEVVPVIEDEPVDREEEHLRRRAAEENLIGAVGRADPPDSSDDDPVSNVDTTSSVADSIQPYDVASSSRLDSSRSHHEQVDSLQSAIMVRPYPRPTQSSSTSEAANSDEMDDEPPDFRFPEWFLSVLNEEYGGGDGDPDYLLEDDFADNNYDDDDDDEGTVQDQADEEPFDDIDEEAIQGCSGDVQGGGDDPLIN